MFRGVTYVADGDAYRAECQIHGRHVSKDFAVKRFGSHKEAQAAAVAERKRMEAESKTPARRPAVTVDATDLNRTLDEFTTKSSGTATRRQTSILEFSKS